jgi:hypothetical protein
MPCDQIRTQKVDMSKVSPEVLAAAMKEAGFAEVNWNRETNIISGYRDGVLVTWTKGVLTSRTSSVTDAQMKKVMGMVTQAYTREAFKFAARRAGFTVQQKAEQLVATRQR